MRTDPMQEKRDLRTFGLLMAAFISLIFGLIVPWLFKLGWPLWPWWLAGAFLATALAWPRLLAPIQRVWLRFGNLMAKVNVYLLLGVVFFLLITPLAVGLRIFRIDLLSHAALHPETYRTPSRPREKQHLEKPF